jgi:hypothetical protein
MVKSKSSNSTLLSGDKLFQLRARTTLPYLVRQAKAGKIIFYSELAIEIGIQNPRNLNYILGYIGTALKNLDSSIPQIQCLVINKQTNLPGDGIEGFIDVKNYSTLSRTQKQELLNRALAQIFSFGKWDWVLQELGLEPIEFEINTLIEEAKYFNGSGGESKFHKDFKELIANNPSLIGLSNYLDKGKTEYLLPSADCIDVIFEDKSTKIGVEVKSRISNEGDILRGLFQCVKYKYLIEAEQVVKNFEPDSRIILVLEGKFPNSLIGVKNALGIEVLDQIRKPSDLK